MIKAKKNAPVALFVYNRIEHTKRTIQALKVNFGADNTDLLVFSDAAKSSADIPKVEQVRKFLEAIDGFKSVSIFKADTNKGLAQSIIEGVSQMINVSGEGIILEDDMVTSPFFLDYMNEALDLYRNDDRVISIHGYVFPTKKPLPETFFMRGTDCWGWATWERGWKHFEKNSDLLISEIQKKGLSSAFNYDDSFDYLGMLKQQAAGKISSWAIRWHASAFLQNKLTLFPGISLVENIGVDGSGTHCGDSTSFSVTLASEKPNIGNIPVEESNIARAAFIHYFKQNRTSLLSRIKNRLKSFLKRVS